MYLHVHITLCLLCLIWTMKIMDYKLEKDLNLTDQRGLGILSVEYWVIKQRIEAVTRYQK